MNHWSARELSSFIEWELSFSKSAATSSFKNPRPMNWPHHKPPNAHGLLQRPVRGLKGNIFPLQKLQGFSPDGYPNICCSALFRSFPIHLKVTIAHPEFLACPLKGWGCIYFFPFRDKGLSDRFYDTTLSPCFASYLLKSQLFCKGSSAQEHKAAV